MFGVDKKHWTLVILALLYACLNSCRCVPIVWALTHPWGVVLRNFVYPFSTPFVLSIGGSMELISFIFFRLAFKLTKILVLSHVRPCITVIRCGSIWSSWWISIVRLLCVHKSKFFTIKFVEVYGSRAQASGKSLHHLNFGVQDIYVIILNFSKYFSSCSHLA